jgi:ElaB/YqjD/DUF883 family membrane-anchored ribosome-binding protein
MESKEISQTHDALVSDTAKLKKSVSKVAEDVKDHATAHVNFVKDKATDTIEKIADYARENPLHIAAGAFALGLFIGFTRRK